MAEFQALLVVSFGGPDGPDDVIPFLENVLRGKNVPRERLLEVADHYQHFGGVSPLNEQNRQLIAKLKEAFVDRGIDLPIYFGNRNWHPMLGDTIQEMNNDGIKRSLAFFTSAYSSYSGCRQYRENIRDALAEIGSDVPSIQKLRRFSSHPKFISANVARICTALEKVNPELLPETQVIFTAHSIPMAMATECDYEDQLKETCQLVANSLGDFEWNLVYQSRSGPPSQPWLEPDVCDFLENVAEKGCRSVVISPIGFLSDHIEVLFDLDTEAKQKCDELGIQVQRAKSVGTHPDFIDMICDLVANCELAADYGDCTETCCQISRHRD